jgi:phosphatidylserine/phosphatidylglycerophosphate/cardiolipin synthase-like enzyme
MKWKYVWMAALIAGAMFFFLAAPKFFSANKNGGNLSSFPSGAFSLITEPDDGIAPVLAMMAGAAKSVDLVMYELDDARVESALVADEQRGVAVRVLLGAGYDGASSTANVAAYDYLRSRGVPVRWSPPYFSLTHEKSLVIDGNRALIMTFNLVAKYYVTGRDFGIVDDNPRDVTAIEGTFDGDWDGSGTGGNGSAALGGNNGARGDDLLWSPGSEPALVGLINGAKNSLFIYNEEMADTAVTKALIDASERGVAVYVDMTGADEWKWEFEELATAGARVRTYADDASAPLYIHAKVIVADGSSAGARAFVGSENFSAGSLDNNRELGIMISDPEIIKSLMKTFVADWRGATPFAP